MKSLFAGVVATALLIAISSSAVGRFDEGIIMTGAHLVSRGALPSVDFYWIYGPAQPLILAFLYSIFDPSVIVGRVYDAVLNGALVAVIVMVALRSRSLIWALALGCCGIGLALGSSMPLYPVTPAALLFLLLVIVSADLFQAAPKRALDLRALAVGSLIAGIISFRYDLAPHAAAIWGGVLLFRFLSAPPNSARFKSFFRTGAISAIPTVFLAIVLLVTGILKPAFIDITQVAGPVYFDSRSLPWPDLASIRDGPVHFAMVYLTPAVVLAVLACGLFSKRAVDEQRINADVALVYISCGAALILYTKGFARPSASHMYLAASMSFLAVAGFGVWLQRTNAKMHVPRNLVLASAMSVGIAMTVYFGLVRARSSWLVASEPTRVACCMFLGPFLPDTAGGAARQRARALERLVALTSPGEKIFSGNGRHDVLILNDTSVYALTGRTLGTRWFSFDPGVQTTEPIQREIIADLERAEVRVIYIDAELDGTAAQLYARQKGSRLLDDYISTNFRTDSTYGPISILVRREKASP